MRLNLTALEFYVIISIAWNQFYFENDWHGNWWTNYLNAQKLPKIWSKAYWKYQYTVCCSKKVHTGPDAYTPNTFNFLASKYSTNLLMWKVWFGVRYAAVLNVLSVCTQPHVLCVCVCARMCAHRHIHCLHHSIYGFILIQPNNKSLYSKYVFICCEYVYILLGK